MDYINSIAFRGGTETAGSSARKVRSVNTNTCPDDKQGCDTVNFRGNEYAYYGEEPKKKSSPLLAITLGIAGVLGIIGGLGYAHKSGAIAKLKEGAFRDKFAEPVTNKCHEWCAWAKKTGKTGWEKIKGIFDKKDK